MASQIIVNGKEVTNPVAKAVIGTVAVLLVGLTAAIVIFLALPLVGIVLSLSAGFVGVVLIALGVGIPLFILGGALLGVLLTPFAILSQRKSSK